MRTVIHGGVVDVVPKAGIGRGTGRFPPLGSGVRPGADVRPHRASRLPGDLGPSHESVLASAAPAGQLGSHVELLAGDRAPPRWSTRKGMPARGSGQAFDGGVSRNYLLALS